MIVRTIPDAGGEWQFVGIFAFNTSIDLAFVIDEVCNPDACEFRFLESGSGIFFDRKIHIYEEDDSIDDAGDWYLMSKFYK